MKRPAIYFAMSLLLAGAILHARQQEYGQRNPSGKGKVFSVIAGQRLTVDFQMIPTGVISGRKAAGNPFESRVEKRPMYNST